MARIYHGLLYFSILKGEKIVKAINTSVFSHNSTISRNFVFWPDVLRASIYPQLSSLYAVNRYLCKELNIPLNIQSSFWRWIVNVSIYKLHMFRCPMKINSLYNIMEVRIANNKSFSFNSYIMLRTYMWWYINLYAFTIYDLSWPLHNWLTGS